MSKDEVTIFYSWQSDEPKTRSYIEKYLKNAIDGVASKPDLEISPRMDKDTQDEVGAVHIAETIKKKIDKCGIFVADVSLVDKGASGRLLVNQNVLFELGYTVGKKSESSVILVANTDLGDLKNLPFDIAYNRIIGFSLKNDPKGEKFQKSIEFAINAHLETISVQEKQDESEVLKENLLSAIDNNKPTRTLSEKYFSQLYKKINSKAPSRYKSRDNIKEYRAQIYNNYETTKPLTEELFEVLSVATEYKKIDVILTAYKQIEIISQYYDIVPEDNGQMYDISRDFYELVVYEIFSIILGCVAKEKLWEILPEINSIKLRRPSGYDKPRTLERLYGYPGAVLEYYKELKDVNYVIPMTPMVEERFKDREDILQAYLNGCLLMYFMVNNHPWLVGLLLGSSWQRYIPDFIGEFRKKSFINILQKIPNVASIDEYRTYLWSQINRDMGHWSYSQDNLLPVFMMEGINQKEDIGKE